MSENPDAVPVNRADEAVRTPEPPPTASSQGSKSRGGRRSVEAAVIVLSILAALFVDAAWDYWNDRRDEHEYLAGLEIEFERAGRELESDQTERIAMVDRMARMLALRGSTNEIPLDSIPDYVLALVDYRFYTPSHPVLEDLLSSGSLRLIRSDSVRATLLVYRQARSRLEYTEARDNAFQTETLYPFVASRIPLDRILGPGVERIREEDAEAFRALMNDDEMTSLLYLRWSELDWSRRFASELARDIEEVLNQVRPE